MAARAPFNMDMTGAAALVHHAQASSPASVRDITKASNSCCVNHLVHAEHGY